jgi:hypothetical protein
VGEDGGKAATVGFGFLFVVLDGRLILVLLLLALELVLGWHWVHCILIKVLRIVHHLVVVLVGSELLLLLLLQFSVGCGLFRLVHGLLLLYLAHWGNVFLLGYSEVVVGRG